MCESLVKWTEEVAYCPTLGKGGGEEMEGKGEGEGWRGGEEMEGKGEGEGGRGGDGRKGRGRGRRGGEEMRGKGREREVSGLSEFGYLQDFDIAGEYDLMIPDAECVRVISEVLMDMKLGKFVIKVCVPMLSLCLSLKLCSSIHLS